MNGLIMDYQLVLPAILRRAEQLHGPREIVTRRPDKSFHRYTYADFVRRAKRLSVALKRLGVESGDRVATLAWNHHQHLEAYFGIPAAGAVVHTINPRLHRDDLAYIVNHARDRILLLDGTLLRVFEQFRDDVDLERVVVISHGEDVPEGMLDYEELLEGADESEFEYPELDERQAAAMCYTSGTTGRPKGVLYSHRALVVHSLVTALAETLAIKEPDAVLPVVPMFHVNAWGLPFTSTLAGAKQVFPGPHLDPQSLLENFERERVTFTAGVPTVFLAVLQALDREPGGWDLSAMRAIVVGGSAAPEGMIRAYRERHNLNVVHAWGMTEMSPIGTICHLTSDLLQLPEEERYRYRATQGRPVPFVEIRARGAEGIVPWDGETYGELEVRGPSVASAYYEAPEDDGKFTPDGWFKTGDIVTIDERGYVEIQDRAKDVIKSGGEWISSVALENALMSHPAVAEAAVIAISDEKWQERPLAVVVLKDGQSATEEELIDYLRPRFAKFWLPDAVEFVDEIPRTATGKFLKMALREQFKDYTPAKK
ncbi:fatty-acid--CoA ligase [Rubrobacter taiwanensis]|jgi:fatty-acyl-CoA synthase|uniref:Fatty-acid--CoA ligase n=1 Tax=Rubrobacter taiwanensis TaxID=185139 RepID=A0A4R1BDY2_9ACTN|nr:long-chain fatty acid--CoA ligase [Rubrobacter taiwanensis]TCJ15300.1 fatty-acid--CoA ligase [Rubrobacter taiwanensis]